MSPSRLSASCLRTFDLTKRKHGFRFHSTSLRASEPVAHSPSWLAQALPLPSSKSMQRSLTSRDKTNRISSAQTRNTQVEQSTCSRFPSFILDQYEERCS